jgi:hypothetical protein
MSETQTQDAPAPTAQPVREGVAKLAQVDPQPRGEKGQFGPKPPPPYETRSFGDLQSVFKDAAQGALRASVLSKETDRAALDNVKPSVKDPVAKTDSDKGKPTGTTSTDKPEPSSKEATRPAPKELDKARKALELEGWTEEDLADIPDEKIAALGKKAGEKHARIAREKREAAEAAKKSTQADPGKKAGATAREDSGDGASEGDEFDALAEEHFGAFEAAEGDDPKAFQKAQARFTRSAVERATASLKVEFEEALTTLQNGVHGQMRLDRMLDRVAREIPQVDELEVRK